MEFTHTFDRPLTNSEILAALRRDNPSKDFAIGPGGSIIESYKTQPDYDFEVSRPMVDRVAASVGATAISSEALDRMMTSDLS